MDDALSTEILSFWAAHEFAGAEAAERLAEVVCVLRGDDGAIAGVSSAFAAGVPIVGGRRFHVFRSLLPGAAAERLPAMIAATHAALNEAFDGAPDAPVGLCVLAGEAERRARPEAEWAHPRMIYAGYLADGRQVRIAYYDGACIGPGERHEGSGLPLKPRHRIVPFAEQSDVTEQDVIDLWLREGAIPAGEAERRVAELHLIGIDADDGPVGVTTAYLQHSEQLRTPMWHYRAFVAASHRQSILATHLAVRGRELLVERYVTQVDRRAPGVVYEVENEFLKAYYPQAHWMPTDFLYIGDSPAGAHVRVHWFPGAHAPEPQGSA